MDDPKNILRDMLTVDVLNNFNNNGIPPHILKLKIGDICIDCHAKYGTQIRFNE